MCYRAGPGIASLASRRAHAQYGGHSDAARIDCGSNPGADGAPIGTYGKHILMNNVILLEGKKDHIFFPFEKKGTDGHRGESFYASVKVF